jgi:hypothetical protein
VSATIYHYVRVVHRFSASEQDKENQQEKHKKNATTAFITTIYLPPITAPVTIYNLLLATNCLKLHCTWRRKKAGDESNHKE